LTFYVHYNKFILLQHVNMLVLGWMRMSHCIVWEAFVHAQLQFFHSTFEDKKVPTLSKHYNGKNCTMNFLMRLVKTLIWQFFVVEIVLKFGSDCIQRCEHLIFTLKIKQIQPSSLWIKSYEYLNINLLCLPSNGSFYLS